jgi:ketosteroid isomerase-like protein
VSDHPTAGDLLRDYYAALDRQSLDDLDRLLDCRCEWLFPGVRLTGPAAVRESLARTLALGVSMQHMVGHLVDQGAVAMCELTATNRLPGQVFTVPGAVVCEARGGRITRLAAYPDSEAMTAFLAALRDRARSLRAARAGTGEAGDTSP